MVQHLRRLIKQIQRQHKPCEQEIDAEKRTGGFDEIPNSVKRKSGGHDGGQHGKMQKDVYRERQRRQENGQRIRRADNRAGKQPNAANRLAQHRFGQKQQQIVYQEIDDQQHINVHDQARHHTKKRFGTVHYTGTESEILSNHGRTPFFARRR